ncbi:AAA family ATPase [Antrihabitans sp. YC2-6]|uniref:AAA family ATPase n=1 Tax=Antrihabitans sp. YC2-6 TaxID=2799498 RepID=UPI0027DB54EC|nr:AAA family ATPase [Antrihabitans sp. YC2-6]
MRTASSFRHTLTQLLQARFPLIYVESHEEQRVLAEIDAVRSALKTPRSMWLWSATQGLRRPGEATERGTLEPAAALSAAGRIHERAVFVFCDLHAFFGDGTRPPDPVVVRWLRDAVRDFRAGEAARTLVLVGPVLRIPAELEKDTTVVDFPLPREDEIRELLDGMIVENTGSVAIMIDDQGRDRLTKAAQGLTLAEAENAFARAMVADGRLTADDVELVLAEKAQTIRKSGLLEIVRTPVALADVGGLDTLKAWLVKRQDSWLEEAARYGLPAPKGVLITGVPGCGKSMTAKAVASAWGLPLIRMDIGKVFAGLVGASEHNMRASIATAEASAPCIMWIDEIEKGFAGAGSAGDTGTSARVFGTFLTWMQEKTAPVFVIATANNIDRLPPEFLRKGRFDEIFFVDLPTPAEREEIWRLHLDRRVRSGPAAGLKVTEVLLEDLATASSEFSGAEIEQAVIAGLFDAYSDRRPLDAADLFHALENTVPLSTTQHDQIADLREWASVRAVSATGVTFPLQP